VLLGGDCSILLGAALGLRRRGRYGIAYLDGHSDLRHVGNTPHVGAAGGEGMALITGRGQPDLTDLDGLAPYVRDADAVVLGIREEDAYRGELADLGISQLTAGQLRERGPRRVAGETLDRLAALDGFWVHLDVDILDPTVMPAVDSPDPGGLSYPELIELLAPLLAAPGFVGIDVAIFDPDLDPDGQIAAELTDALVSAFPRSTAAQ
jgi:arginase